tara:strand:- start:454 stop:1044 length:591 start_codon:yes stop_codon:yes gene_type:complete
MSKQFGIGPTFDNVGNSPVISECDSCTLLIEDGAFKYPDKPNKKLTAQNTTDMGGDGDDVYLAYLNLKCRVLECDVEDNIGKTFWAFVGLSAWDWNIPKLLEQMDLGIMLDQFDVTRDTYVGDVERPDLASLSHQEGWEAVGNYFLTGELTDTLDRNLNQPSGMIGKEFTCNFGPIKAGVDGNGKERDETGFMNVD